MPFSQRPFVAAAAAAFAAALLGGCLPHAITPRTGGLAAAAGTLGLSPIAGDRKGHKVDDAPIAR